MARACATARAAASERPVAGSASFRKRDGPLSMFRAGPSTDVCHPSSRARACVDIRGGSHHACCISARMSRRARTGDLDVIVLRTSAYATNMDTHHASDAARRGRQVYPVRVIVTPVDAHALCWNAVIWMMVVASPAMAFGRRSQATLLTVHPSACGKDVRVLGAKQTVTYGAQGRNVATGSVSHAESSTKHDAPVASYSLEFLSQPWRMPPDAVCTTTPDACCAPPAVA
jgi:hypothetical protein